MNTSRSALPSGASLIEVLIVIAILSLLMSLMFPAIQAAREAARRTQCANNQRQFGIAFITFESDRGAFPSGFSLRVTGPVLSSPEVQWHNFIADLLPFFEEGGIDAQYHRDAVFCAPENAIAIGTPLNIAVCPSAPEREAAPTNTFIPSLLITPSAQRASGIAGAALDILDKKYKATYQGGITDYSVPANADKNLATSLGYKVASNSIRELPSMFPWPDTNKLLQGVLPLLIGSGSAEFNERTRGKQITDGLSHTFMLTEVAGRPQHWQAGARMQMDEPLVSAWADPSIVFKIKETKTPAGKCLINCDNDGKIYSFHQEGANFLFADGHVDYLESNIEPRLLLALMTPDQGDATQ